MKNFQKGYFTIEATFILLTVFLVIFGLIYFTFHLQDLTQIQTAMNESLQEEAYYFKHCIDNKTGDIMYENINQKGLFSCYVSEVNVKKIKENLFSKLDNKLIITTISNVDIKKVGQNIKIVVKSQLNIGISKVKAYFLGVGIDHSQEQKISIHNPAEFLRGYKAISVLVEDMKGYKVIEQLFKKINDVYSN